MEKIIAEYPAYKIIENPQAKYKADDVIAIPFKSVRHGTLYHFFTFGSAVSYALKYNECPIKSYNQEKECGNPTHWLNANSVCIHNGPKKQDVVFGQQIGDIVYFEGRKFEIKSAPNNNVKLFEIEAN